jgi:hypothetical protein
MKYIKYIILTLMFFSLLCIESYAQIGETEEAKYTFTSISCNLSIEADSIVLEFINKSDFQMAFIMGKGSPEYYIRYDPITITANFTCQLDYLHHCFHIEKIKIAPNKKKTFKFSVIDDKLREIIGSKKVKCIYKTLK